MSCHHGEAGLYTKRDACDLCEDEQADLIRELKAEKRQALNALGGTAKEARRFALEQAAQLADAEAARHAERRLHVHKVAFLAVARAIRALKEKADAT